MLASALVLTKQEAHLSLWIIGVHQSVADEDRVHSRLLESCDLDWIFDPTLRDNGLTGGDVSQQLKSAIHVDIQGFEISVVDADYVRVKLQRSIELVAGSNLDDAIEVQGFRFPVEVCERLLVQDCRYQQHCVGSEYRRLEDLVAIDDEILSQNRQVTRFARFAQILESAAKVLVIRKHRKSRRPSALIGDNLIGYDR